MKTFFVVLLLYPATLLAQSPFDGTWVVNSDTIRFPHQPENYVLQNGEYECSSCVPKIKVKADGEDHKVAGSPYFSTIAVQVMDLYDVHITEKLRDRTVLSEIDTVSADGNTLVQKITDTAAPSGEAVTATETYKRVGAGPAGSSPICGSWQAEKIEGFSENGMSVTYRSTNGGLEASNSSGEGYSAKFDEKEYPIHGEPAHNTVSLQRIDPNTIVETDKQDGEIHYKVRSTVSPDGKSMQVIEVDNERGTQMSYTMNKKEQ